MKFFVAAAVLALNVPAYAEITAMSASSENYMGADGVSRVAIVRANEANMAPLVQALRNHGLEVVSEDDADLRLELSSLYVVMDVQGEQRQVTYSDVVALNDAVIPASPVDKLKAPVISAKTGTTRGAFSLDGGVVNQASRLTGSGAGGIVVGMIGGLIGGLFDQAALDKKGVQIEDQVGAAALVGRVTLRNGSDVQTIQVGITAASSTPEHPTTLLYATLHKFVGIAKNGLMMYETATVEVPKGVLKASATSLQDTSAESAR